MRLSLLFCSSLVLSASALPLPAADNPTSAGLPDYRPVAGWPKLPDGVKLGAASAVEADGQGTIYVLHRGKKPILAFDRAGKFLRSWGDGIIKIGHGLRIDRAGNIWATDIGGHQVFKFDPQGKLLLTLGTRDKPGDGTNQFNKPTDIAFAANGDFFVTDGYGNNRVVKFSKEGKYLKQWGTRGTGDGAFHLPHSIVIDARGRLYVGDRENNRVQLFDGDGKFLGQWRQSGAPYGLFLSGDRLFVADGRANWIMVLDATGKPIGRFGQKGTGPNQFSMPHMLCVDSDGAVYVAEVENKRVQKFVAPSEDLTVLKTGPDGVPPRKMLSTFLKAECQKQFDARKKVVAALKTPEDVQQRQQSLRKQFIQALGGFPEKTPLNGKVVGQIEGKGFHIEKVIYESRPDHHVTALLYLPPGKGPFPGVVLPCGHGAAGKADGAYQRACMLLATNGIAALCYDPIGQGERMQILDAQGKPIISGTTEHTMLDVGALLVGRCTASYRIWDGIRSIDYLCSRPEIDPKRLGCTGVSGGGTLTSYLMALDERIFCAAPSCYITSLERLFATLGPQDGEQNIPGQVAFGMDHADYITMRAPRPTLILCATKDFFDIQGTWTSFREAKQVYGILGHPERVEIAEFNTTHGYPKVQREAMVRWMRRWLLGKDDYVSEPEFTTYKTADLQCTRTGQVLEDFKGTSVGYQNEKRWRELTSHRYEEWDGLSRAARNHIVWQTLSLPDVIFLAKRKVVDEVKRKELVIEKVIYETEPGILLPALEFRPVYRNPDRIVVYVNGEGKQADATPEMLAGSGKLVIAIDLRGFGETAPAKANPVRPGYFGVDVTESFLAMHLNRPLLSQRTFDLLSVMAQARTRNLPIELVGVGVAGPVVLHAAFLAPKPVPLTLRGSLVSWASVARNPISINQMTNVIPGALAWYDLPDLLTAQAPERLTVQKAVDQEGKLLTQDDLESVCQSCRAAFKKQKAEGALILNQK